jgi:hypothetical protein
VIDEVVAPFDHTLFVGEEDVSTTLLPEQNVVGPPAEMVGTAGIGFTVTVIAVEGSDVQPPDVFVTVYVPEADTVIDGLAAPVDHIRLPGGEAVSVTLPPAQKVVGPLVVTVGAAGVGFTVTVCAVELPDEQPLVTTSTV